MPSKSDRRMMQQMEFDDSPRVFELERETDDLRRQNDEFRRENETLRQQYEKVENDAGLLADKVLMANGELESGHLLLMAAGLVAGRTALFAFVDLRFPALIWAVNGVYGALGLVLLGKWLVVGWKEMKWMLVPAFVTVFNAMLAAAALVWGGVRYPVAAALTIIVTFLFVAARGCDLLLPRLLVVLRNPKSLVKGSDDKRRKN